MKIHTLLLAGSMIASLSLGNFIEAADSPSFEADEVSSLFASMENATSPSSSSDRSTGSMTSSEFRQARAQYRSSRRITRLETQSWLGYEPLRPNWSSTPMTSSRYAPMRTYYLPIYHYGR